MSNKWVVIVKGVYVMRKFVAFVCLIALLLSFVACGAKNNNVWVPESVSKDLRPYAETALDILNQYLSFSISSDDAAAKFEELQHRVDTIGIDPYSADTSPADSQIIQAIKHVDMFCFSIVSEEEDVFLYKDIISFQLGNSLSGKSYPADKIYTTEDSKTHLDIFLSVDTAPFSDAFVYYDENGAFWQISLTFDKLNGIAIEGLGKYINEILENAYANDIDSLEIDIHYEVCGQDAATICAEANRDSVYFYSLRSLRERSSAIDRLHSEYSAEEIAKFENFPSKYDVLNPISEAHAVEDLPALLADTAKYVGH